MSLLTERLVRDVNEYDRTYWSTYESYGYAPIPQASRYLFVRWISSFGTFSLVIDFAHDIRVVLIVCVCEYEREYFAKLLRLYLLQRLLNYESDRLSQTQLFWIL